jgi:hypothetical protein
MENMFDMDALSQPQTAPSVEDYASNAHETQAETNLRVRRGIENARSRLVQRPQDLSALDITFAMAVRHNVSQKVIKAIIDSGFDSVSLMTDNLAVLIQKIAMAREVKCNWNNVIHMAQYDEVLLERELDTFKSSRVTLYEGNIWSFLAENHEIHKRIDGDIIELLVGNISVAWNYMKKWDAQDVSNIKSFLEKYSSMKNDRVAYSVHEIDETKLMWMRLLEVFYKFEIVSGKLHLTLRPEQPGRIFFDTVTDGIKFSMKKVSETVMTLKSIMHDSISFPVVPPSFKNNASFIVLVALEQSGLDIGSVTSFFDKEEVVHLLDKAQSVMASQEFAKTDKMSAGEARGYYYSIFKTTRSWRSSVADLDVVSHDMFNPAKGLLHFNESVSNGTKWAKLLMTYEKFVPFQWVTTDVVVFGGSLPLLRLLKMKKPRSLWCFTTRPGQDWSDYATITQVNNYDWEKVAVTFEIGKDTLMIMDYLSKSESTPETEYRDSIDRWRKMIDQAKSSGVGALIFNTRLPGPGIDVADPLVLLNGFTKVSWIKHGRFHNNELSFVAYYSSVAKQRGAKELEGEKNSFELWVKKICAMGIVANNLRNAAMSYGLPDYVPVSNRGGKPDADLKFYLDVLFSTTTWQDLKRVSPQYEIAEDVKPVEMDMESLSMGGIGPMEVEDVYQPTTRPRKRSGSVKKGFSNNNNEME